MCRLAAEGPLPVGGGSKVSPRSRPTGTSRGTELGSTSNLWCGRDLVLMAAFAEHGDDPGIMAHYMAADVSDGVTISERDDAGGRLPKHAELPPVDRVRLQADAHHRRCGPPHPGRGRLNVLDLSPNRRRERESAATTVACAIGLVALDVQMSPR